MLLLGCTGDCSTFEKVSQTISLKRFKIANTHDQQSFLLFMWMRHKVLLWLLGSVTDTLMPQTAQFSLVLVTLCWWFGLCVGQCAGGLASVGQCGQCVGQCGQCAGGLASDTLPLLQPCCQSVSRQSGGARQYILCSPNTLNTEYISAPNTPWIHTHVCGSATEYQHIQQTPNSGQRCPEYNSRI